MVHHWLFHLWWANKIREQKDSPFVLKSETEYLKSSCILEVLNTIERDWLSLKVSVERLGIKTIQNLSAQVFRDGFKKETLLPNPVFSNNQVAKITGKYWLYLILLLFLTGVEGGLYYISASLFIPGSPMELQVALAVFLACIVMFSLSFAFGKHFKHREALDRKQKNEISQNHLTSYRHWAYIGYVVAAVAILGVVFAGISRIYYFENIDTKGLKGARLENVLLASKWASRFTMCITIMTSLLTAILKLQFTKVSRQYRSYRLWHNAHIKRNRITQVFIVSCGRIKLKTEQRIEKYFQLLGDMKRILKLSLEYDKQYQALNEEYIALRGKPGFQLNEDIYRKFSALQCAYEELFRYGILNEHALKAKIDAAHVIVQVLQEHQDEHKLVRKNLSPSILPSLNGSGKNLTLIHQ